MYLDVKPVPFHILLLYNITLFLNVILVPALPVTQSACRVAHKLTSSCSYLVFVEFLV